MVLLPGGSGCSDDADCKERIASYSPKLIRGQWPHLYGFSRVRMRLWRFSVLVSANDFGKSDICTAVRFCATIDVTEVGSWIHSTSRKRRTVRFLTGMNAMMDF